MLRPEVSRRGQFSLSRFVLSKASLVTTGGQPASSIPVDIPENAFVTEFLPFEEILPHVDLLIANGGYGTVNMALAHGVPIISGGLTEDKEVVSALVQRVGVGIDLRVRGHR